MSQPVDPVWLSGMTAVVESAELAAQACYEMGLTLKQAQALGDRYFPLPPEGDDGP